MFGILNRQGKNGIYVSLRLLLVLALSLMIYSIQPRAISDFASVQDMAIPAIIGIFGAIVIAVLMLIKSLQAYIPLSILPLDWALAAAYLYFHGNEPSLVLGIIGALVITGFFRLGSSAGRIYVIGLLVVSAISLALSPQVGFEALRETPLTYVPVLIVALLFSILAGLWYNALDEENDKNRQQVREEILEARTRLDNMRERMKAFAELTMRLNATLNYNQILNAAMDIGRMSIRQDPKDRVVGLALMVVSIDEFAIAAARGINHIEESRTFRGHEGILAQVIREGEPVIIEDGESDPELSSLNAFINMRSTLAIPLRAKYETYGILVFATTGKNAINEDHIDILAAIGTQATLALQNSILYSTLHEEKERIIRIESNGRKSLVRDLHDIPTQTVSAIAMQLSVLPMVVERDAAKLRPEVENIRQMALRASEEIRHVMFTLRPLSLETSGLSAALDQLAEKMQTTYGQGMTVNVDRRIEEYLDKDQQGTLFYLIEEAANNARKYAQAKMIQVRVAIEKTDIVVKIRDNGKGFNPAAVNKNYEERGSFGMVNMRERAELVSGSFELESAVGMGTTVTVRVPTYDPNLVDDTANRKAPPLRNLKQKKHYSGPLSPST